MGPRSALINHFHTLEEEHSAGAAKKKESLERRKHINTRLRELRSTHYQRHSDEDNQEIQDLEFQKRTGKEKRDAWDLCQKVLAEEIDELHSGELKNIRLKGAHADSRPQVEKENVALKNGVQNGSETDNGLPADIDMADNMVVNSSPQFHNYSNLPVQASILAPQIGLPPPVPSTSVTALDDLAAFEEANHDKLAAFFDDPLVQKLMDQSMSI
ncbi:hypothetical protein K439DRAFT_1625186 [Ramaria rubella]|nr:hypothetical protein K439DRAFT_1625186 [Ramaria rubella]